MAKISQEDVKETSICLISDILLLLTILQARNFCMLRFGDTYYCSFFDVVYCLNLLNIGSHNSESKEP